jgi:diketogulonate reductase-like aldo/keto reductase
LRWVLEQGVTPVVKSFNKVRMRENLHIFNWELSADDLVKIKKIPQRRAGLVREFVSEDRPDKTLEDLCDGEL